MVYQYQQDGADFYLYDDEQKLEAVITYPHGVGLDLAKAQEARGWFLRLVSDWGLTVTERPL